MATTATGGGSLLPSFQSRLIEALKAEGLIPMTTGITHPVHEESDYGMVLADATASVEQASVQFGSRAVDRYSTDVGSSYRDQRFAMIASLENVRTHVYEDTGNKAVGLGFNMDKPGARDVWQAALPQVSFDDVYKGKASISPAQAKQLFDHDVVYFERVVDKVAGDRPLTQNQRLALVSVAYTSPKRVESWAPVVQSGNDAAVMDLILTKSFKADHPQSEGLKKRRFVEASVYASTAEADQLLPRFNDYMEAVQVDSKSGAVTVNGAPVPHDRPALLAIDQSFGSTTRQGVAIPEASSFTYDYSSSTKRNLPVNENLVREITNGVTAVYGGDYKVSVISGAQGEGSRGQTGSRRHNTGVAADVFVYSPEGKRLTPDELVPLAQHWVASGTGSVGFPANGQSMHLDLVGGKGPGSVPRTKKEGAVWYYGTPTSTQMAKINAGLAGTRPSYTLSPDIVAKGLIPREELPKVASELDVTNRTAPVPAKQSNALRTNRMLNKPTNGAPEPVKQTTAMRANRVINEPIQGRPAPKSVDMQLMTSPNSSPVAKLAQVTIETPDKVAPVPASQSDALRRRRAGTVPGSISKAAASVGVRSTVGVTSNGNGTMGVQQGVPRPIRASSSGGSSSGGSGSRTIMTSNNGTQTVGQRVNGSEKGYTVSSNPRFNEMRGL